MAICFDQSDYQEEEGDELTPYDEGTSFPYPFTHGQPEQVNMKKSQARFSLVRLNIQTACNKTELKRLRTNARHKRKILLRVP